MTDDELDRHLRDIIHGLRVDAVPTRSARDRLRLAIDAAVRAEREACKAIAGQCAEERAAALTGFPVVLTPARSMAYYTVAAKQSEAERIAELIANRSNTP